MDQHHPIAISGRQQTMLGQLIKLSATGLFRCMRRTLTLLLSGFIISIFHFRRKRVRDLSTGMQPQIHEGQELKQATQLEDQFIEVASHELRTPMTTISGHTQLLLRRLSRIQELSSEMAVIRTSLERIDGQTRRLNAIVNELLELSCIRAGKIDMHAEKCNLREICCQVVEQQHTLTDRRITLNAPTVSILLEADCARLREVAFNLVDNAVKYSSPESTVEVNLSRDEEVALIEVRDSGSGILEDEQQHLFDAFYRGPYMQTTPQSGMGLGLTICREIVNRHGGRIWCESRENAGSSFFVELPLSQ
ncbi:MAG TPA: HAMP domain-containing sensor histidine kinase [Ktedonobacteraceae bacterium]